jgi:hypothetical protein
VLSELQQKHIQGAEDSMPHLRHLATCCSRCLYRMTLLRCCSPEIQSTVCCHSML